MFREMGILGKRRQKCRKLPDSFRRRGNWEFMEQFDGTGGEAALPSPGEKVAQIMPTV